MVLQGFRCASELLESLRLKQITWLTFMVQILIQIPVLIERILQVQKERSRYQHCSSCSPWLELIPSERTQLNTSSSEVWPLTACAWPQVPQEAKTTQFWCRCQRKNKTSK